jgi:tRNA A37 threonylcarbamoyladenosine dehydratase
MEGVGGRFRLADFDVFSLSNMNRLRASVQDVGLKKTHLAARQMFEIDPYLEIEIWPDGLSPERFDEFFLGEGPLICSWRSATTST